VASSHHQWLAQTCVQPTTNGENIKLLINQSKTQDEVEDQLIIVLATRFKTKYLGSKLLPGSFSTS